MATFNGRRFIEQQVATILGQEGVQVRLVISDDGSTDGTVEWLEELADQDPRVTVLPRRQGPAGVGENFLYALSHLEVEPGQYAAFSDQDDLWRPGKLAYQVQLLQDSGAAAVSANAVAFQEVEVDPHTGKSRIRKRVIHKDQPQRQWDFVFEAPSTGSTFLMDYDLWKLVTQEHQEFGATGVWLHDWYVYALARAAGMRWVIDGRTQVAYRQHDSNALGQHRGLGAVWSRLTNLRNGVYRQQFLLVTRDCLRVGEACGRSEEWLSELREVERLLQDQSLGARLALAAKFRQIRRSRFDGVALATACVLGLW